MVDTNNRDGVDMSLSNGSVHRADSAHSGLLGCVIDTTKADQGVITAARFREGCDEHGPTLRFPKPLKNQLGRGP